MPTSTARELLKIKPKREITLTKEETKAGETAGVQKTEEIKDLLLLITERRTLPEDFKIGRLQDILEGSRDQKGIISAAQKFLEALAKGKIEEDSLLQSKRERISHSLSYFIEQKILLKSYRLGHVSLQEEETSDGSGIGNSASMNIRLFGEVGVSEGELYFSRHDMKWYIEDILISLELLSQSYSRQEEKFIPSPYNWRNP